MENKKFLMAVLLTSILVLSGCAVKDYLKRYVVKEGANYTLLSEKEKLLTEGEGTETEDITKFFLRQESGISR